MRGWSISVLALSAIWFVAADVAAVDKVPTNTWSRIVEGGTGPQGGVGLVYAPSLDRFVLHAGAVNAPEKAPFPYDVLSFRLGEKTWRNEFPAGKDWGPQYGPANPPGMKNGWPHLSPPVDKEGNCRPHRQAVNSTTFHYAVDPDANGMWAIVHGRTMFHSFADMTWQDFGDAEGPGAGTGGRLHFGSLVYDPVNREVIEFGGLWGSPQVEGATTWLFSTAEKKWRKLEPASPCLDPLRREAGELRGAAKDLVAALRNRLHRTEQATQAAADLASEAGALAARVEALAGKLSKAKPGSEQEKRQLDWALNDLTEAATQLKKIHREGRIVTAETVKTAFEAEWSLVRAHDDLETQPPPRIKSALACDPKRGKVVLFGGDRGDHLSADTWVYDLKTRTWAEQRPALSPPPRGGHALVYLPKSGRILLLGGYEYGNPGGRGIHTPIPQLDMWCYDVAANQWKLIKHFEAGEVPAFAGGYVGCAPAVVAVGRDDVVLAPVYTGVDKPRDTWACQIDATISDDAEAARLGVPPGAVKRSTGALDPHWFEDGPAPDESQIAETLANLPANQWVAMEPPKLFTGHGCRSWSTFAFDPHRDQILLWGGGHGDYGGTSVAHYSPRQNRWSIGFYAECNMDYKPESSAGGWSIMAPFTGRPYAGHSYLTYDYHPPTRKMYFIYGRGNAERNYLWAYDPDRRDWELPKPLPFPAHPHNGALRSTGHGLVGWNSEGLWLCPDPTSGQWEQLIEKGKHSIPKHYTEESGLVWDSKRDRLLLFNLRQNGPKVWVYDFKTKSASMLEPKGSDKFPRSAIYGWQACYLPDDDLVMVPTPAKPNPLTLFYDCAANEWLRLDNVGGKDGSLPTPDGYGVSIGLMWDPARKLIWIGDGYMPGGRIWVMKFDRKRANLKPAGEGL